MIAATPAMCFPSQQLLMTNTRRRFILQLAQSVTSFLWQSGLLQYEGGIGGNRGMVEIGKWWK
jgi:hypothetical protein